MQTINIKGKEYAVIDSYDYDGKSISILEHKSKYFIDNYEGTGIFIGPFAEAIKTGANGEILVRDLRKNYYYVPGLKKEKAPGVGFLKKYHPEYHYAEPYTYNQHSFFTPVKMVDGTIRLKHCDGSLSQETYKYYHTDNGIAVYETEDGKAYASAADLTLPLEYVVRPDSSVESYQGNDVFSYQAIKTYNDYIKGDKSLKDLPHNFFIIDAFVESVLKEEKRRLFVTLTNETELARNKVKSAAKESNESAISEIEINETQLQEMLNSIADIVVSKRRIAVQEVEKLSQIDKQERKVSYKASKVLDMDNIIKKSAAKPRKKNGLGGGYNQNNPAQKGEE